MSRHACKHYNTTVKNVIFDILWVDLCSFIEQQKHERWIKNVYFLWSPPPNPFFFVHVFPWILSGLNAFFLDLINPHCPLPQHLTRRHLRCHCPSLLRMALCQAQRASSFPGLPPFFRQNKNVFQYVASYDWNLSAVPLLASTQLGALTLARHRAETFRHNTDDKGVQKQQNILCLHLCFWQTRLPTSCIQDPGELGVHSLVLNNI